MGRFDPLTEHMLKHGYNDSSEDKSFIDQTDGMVCIHIGFCVHRCLYTRVAQIFMSFEKEEGTCKYYYLPDYFAKADYEVSFYSYPPVVFITRGSLQITEAKYFMDIPVVDNRRDIITTSFCFLKEYHKESCSFSYSLFYNGDLHKAFPYEEEIIRRYFANNTSNEEHQKERQAIYKLNDVREDISKKEKEYKKYIDSIDIDELLNRLTIFRKVEAGPYKIGEGRDFEIIKISSIEGLSDPYLISCFGIGSVSEYSEVMFYAYSNPWDDYMKDKYPRGLFPKDQVDEEREKCKKRYNKVQHLKWLLDDYIQRTYFPKPKDYNLKISVLYEHRIELLLLNIVREKKRFRDELSKIDKRGGLLRIGGKALDKLNCDVKELCHLALTGEPEYKSL